MHLCRFSSLRAGNRRELRADSSQLEESLSRDNLRFQVSSSGVEGGMVTFSAQMYFEPTLFGKGRLSGVFGFSFPPLSHGSQISVSAYKPGLVF